MTQDQRNKKAEQLRLAARIIETGCEWEAKGQSMDNWFVSAYNDPVFAISDGYEIRIKEWKLPDPPAGRKWHREDWKQEMLPDGWRPLLDGEKALDGDEMNNETGWVQPPETSFTNYQYRCRTRRQLPEPVIPVPVAKPRVPLGPCDIVPGSVIELAGGEEGWNLILVASKDGITVLDKNNHPQDYTFEELVEGHFESRIKRPTDTEWQPCSKLEDEA